MTVSMFAPLEAVGLDLHAVFDVATLPPDVRAALPPAARGQLILIGNAGPVFWQALTRSGLESDHPIDDFSHQTVARWLAQHTDLASVHWLYPGDTALGLQRLGALAGWHHASPFKVGIHPRWGSWFAYRAAVIADTRLPLTAQPTPTTSPCETCVSRPCEGACPAGALRGDAFSLEACLRYRTRADSACAATCLARLACPVGTAYRYPAAQIRHMYGHSLAMIRAYRPDLDPA